ncbi:MAG: VanZ family protein [Culicoidibacterales bacterium]
MNVEGQYLTVAVPYVLWIGISVLVFLMSVLRKRTYKTVLRGTFFAYCVQVIYFTFLSNPFYLAFDQQARLSLQAIFGKHPFLFKNLIPFSSIADQLVWHYWDVSMFLNIGLTIPLGILLVLRKTMYQQPVRLRNILKQGLFFSLMIESMQMLVNYGLQYRHRVVTIDDVIMNVLGTLIGALVTMLVIWIWQKITQRKRRTR